MARVKAEAEKEAVAYVPVTRNSEGLRDAIFDEIDAIRNGGSNPTRANAVAKLVLGVVETVRMQLEVQRHFSKMAPDQIDQAMAVLEKPIRLGAALRKDEAA